MRGKTNLHVTVKDLTNGIWNKMHIMASNYKCRSCRSAALHEREIEKAKQQKNLGTAVLIDRQMQAQINGTASEVISRAQVRCICSLLSFAAFVL